MFFLSDSFTNSEMINDILESYGPSQYPVDFILSSLYLLYRFYTHNGHLVDFVPTISKREVSWIHKSRLASHCRLLTAARGLAHRYNLTWTMSESSQINLQIIRPNWNITVTATMHRTTDDSLDRHQNRPPHPNASYSYLILPINCTIAPPSTTASSHLCIKNDQSSLCSSHAVGCRLRPPSKIVQSVSPLDCPHSFSFATFLYIPFIYTFPFITIQQPPYLFPSSTTFHLITIKSTIYYSLFS